MSKLIQMPNAGNIQLFSALDKMLKENLKVQLINPTIENTLGTFEVLDDNDFNKCNEIIQNCIKNKA